MQRNTRPSTHDVPLPVYGQETVRAVPLPHHRAGKISFFLCTPVKTTTKFYYLINALTDLGTNKTMFKDFRRLKFLSNPSCRFGLRRVRKGFISWSKENFFLQDNHGKSRAGKICPSCLLESSTRIEDSPYLARSRIQSYYRKPYKNKKPGKMAPFSSSVIITFPIVHFSMYCLGKVCNIAS